MCGRINIMAALHLQSGAGGGGRMPARQEQTNHQKYARPEETAAEMTCNKTQRRTHRMKAGKAGKAGKAVRVRPLSAVRRWIITKNGI